LVRDAIDAVHELGVLSKQSGKFQNILASVASSQPDKVLTVRPLCPTRWTVRAKAIGNAVGQYESILEALEEMAASTGNVATRTSALKTTFVKGSTLLGLLIALEIVYTTTGEFESSTAGATNNCEWDSAGSSSSKRIHDDHTLRRCIQFTFFESRKGTTGHGFGQHCSPA